MPGNAAGQEGPCGQEGPARKEGAARKEEGREEGGKKEAGQLRPVQNPRGGGVAFPPEVGPA